MEQSSTNQIKKTALHGRHVALGAKMVDFCGWSMPVQYQSIIAEHNAVRHHAGIFDVSHMGRIEISGPDTERFLDHLSTNAISGKPDQSAVYTVWPDSSGGCVDDVIVYREEAEKFFVIVNAGNRAKDLQHLRNEAKKYRVTVQDHYQDGILAIQGPAARKILARTFPEVNSLKHMRFTSQLFQNEKVYVSCTGYTGEDGFEIYAPNSVVAALWDKLLSDGNQEGLLPVGLGARDTLRLEKGYALYGHEISESIAPNESVSAWTIKWNKEFIGKQAMEAIEQSPKKRFEYGVILQEPGVARADYEVWKNDNLIGRVTSGTHSPTLNQSIAIILVDSKLNFEEIVDIKIRNKTVKAKIAKIPFVS